MLEIRCSGTPFEIGLHHGTAAKAQVHGSISFYRTLFHKTCALTWPEVWTEAARYIPALERTRPAYLSEMRGIAQGAGVDLLDILALNARTEIVFGLFTKNPGAEIKTDGCTSVALRSAGGTLLAQNWDWQAEQAPNLLICHISRETGVPDLVMVTEGGVIGKIGFNDCGVGVCLNAIRARGVDESKLPVHLGLRAALECKSRAEAAETLMKLGIAGSAHILVADGEGATGLECTVKGINELEMDGKGRVVHSNHLLLHHPGVEEPAWLKDSPVRVDRMHKLLDKKMEGGRIGVPELLDVFKDQDGYPCSINRAQTGESEIQTVFNIIMELGERRAVVRCGRPTDDGEVIHLSL